jgi:hypothetical protein
MNIAATSSMSVKAGSGDFRFWILDFGFKPATPLWAGFGVGDSGFGDFGFWMPISFLKSSRCNRHWILDFGFKPVTLVSPALPCSISLLSSSRLSMAYRLLLTAYSAVSPHAGCCRPQRTTDPLTADFPIRFSSLLPTAYCLLPTTYSALSPLRYCCGWGGWGGWFGTPSGTLNGRIPGPPGSLATGVLVAASRISGKRTM